MGTKQRRVAFFHSHASDKRKSEILHDLQLPLESEEKKIICVVSTVSLGRILLPQLPEVIKKSIGVGVDIRVDNAVMFGLSENAENFLQEGGRPMRGSNLETKGKQGYAFFFHKGILG